MSNEGWFEVITKTSTLRQGDLIDEVPVVRADTLEWPPKDGAELPVSIDIEQRAIVISQSCDLENDKIKDVILAQVLDWSSACKAMVTAGNKLAKSKKFRKALVDGNIPSLHLLQKHDDEPTLSWSVVDFHRLFVVPKTLVLETAQRQKSRLRLRSPYREHFAQAFARYFMRVGLPLDARAFEDEGVVEI